jgi:D-glycero-alpha-D-manno-heptose 1-phosphate guanylyltransferase
LLHSFPVEERFSMETQVFPALLAQGARLRVLRCEDRFLDIGTPESLGQAEAFIRDSLMPRVYCQKWVSL